MKTKLLALTCLIASFLPSFSQTNKEIAASYLKENGDVAFTFKAENLEQVQELAMIVSFDHDQNHLDRLTINAIANEKEFNEFLSFNLPFTIQPEKNEPLEVEMYDKNIHGLASRNPSYTLSFPLTAYPTYDDYVDQMNEFATQNSSIAELVDIGNSVDGRELLFIKLSDNVSTHEQEPRLMFTSSMHGDEIAGFPMMLMLIDHLIEAYNDVAHANHAEVKDLLDNNEIWINPLANPDGTYRGDNSTVSNARRGNANNIDLNRNYPDPRVGANPDGNAYQTETLAFMNLADNYHFVIAANFHGGTEVMNYPWDTWSVAQGRHADDDWYIYICGEYAANAQTDGPSGYFDASYDSNANSVLGFTGVTHGATWYQVAGGRQDYMNHDKQCREVTVELSNTKLISGSDLDDHWDYNRNALVDYLKQGTYGFRGVVKDANSLEPIQAKITIDGHDDSRGSWVNTELPIGDFYRPIKGGTYDIIIEADCYENDTLKSRTIADLQTIDLGDILMTKAAPSDFSESNITTVSATINWSQTADSFDIRYRELGHPTWSELTVGANSADLTGLTHSTTYEYEVRSTCGTVTSAYSGTQTFNTAVPIPCTGATENTYPINQSFESGIGNWTQATNGSEDDIDWMVNSGTTPSNNTGPGSAFHGSNYIYTEASTNVTPEGSPNKTAYLISPCIDLSLYEDAALSFYYHMNGTAMGSFMVDISTDNGSSWVNVFSISGDQPDAWMLQNVDLSTYDGQVVKLRLHGLTGSGWSSDIAIDNMVINANINSVLSTNEVALNNLVKVYPNPSSKDIYIKSSSNNMLQSYTLTNMIGQQVLSRVENEIETRIDVSQLTKGVYFLSIATQNGTLNKKIIVQ